MKADQPNQIDIKLGYIVQAKDIIDLSEQNRLFDLVAKYNYEKATEYARVKMKNNELYDLTNKDYMIVGFYNFILQVSSMYRRETFSYHLGRLCCGLLTYGQVLYKDFFNNGRIRTEFRGKYTEWHITSNNTSYNNKVEFNISKKIDTFIYLYVEIDDQLDEEQSSYIDRFLSQLEIRGVNVIKLHRDELSLKAIEAENDEVYQMSIKNDMFEDCIYQLPSYIFQLISFMSKAGNDLEADRYSLKSFLDANEFTSEFNLSNYLTARMFERSKVMTIENLMIKALGDESCIFNNAESIDTKYYRQEANLNIDKNKKNIDLLDFLGLSFYLLQRTDAWTLSAVEQDFYYRPQEAKILKNTEETKEILSSLISDLELYAYLNYNVYARYSIKAYNILNKTGLFMPISKISIEIL